MKKLLFILLFMTPFYTKAQSALQLEKNTATEPVILTVKPGKKIRLRTLQGDNLTLREYTL